MNKYAVVIKHAFRDISDVRIDIVQVPKDLTEIGPFEVKKFIEQKLLGNFEVLAVTDRISIIDFDREWK